MATAKELRLAKGWRQLDLAYNAKVAIRVIYALESGHAIHKRSLLRIAQALGVPPNEISEAKAIERVGKAGWAAVDLSKLAGVGQC
ncbi:MAG TPA: helix-turn-helix transcriptional regulator [Ktedonobacteraceae bacterium]|jgi:transcriptional regulator with XRE-family HTH domain